MDIAKFFKPRRDGLVADKKDKDGVHGKINQAHLQTTWSPTVVRSQKNRFLGTYM